MSKPSRKSKEAAIPALPNPGLTAEEVVADRILRFERLQEFEEARKLIPVTMGENRPMGILFFGDPHLDNPGTNLKLVKDHALLVRGTPGLYGANVGDTTDNWIGRLERLYASSSVTKEEGLLLAEWFIQLVRDWLFIIKGNHDMWSGANDPLDWIAHLAKAFIQDAEARVALRFPNGREVRINARHEHKGKSMYNTAHGPLKQLHMGKRDHVAISGHTHESGYSILKDGNSGITMHAVKVASYKTYDHYARTEGFADQAVSPCVLLTIDPRLPENHPDLVKQFWDPHEGAAYLNHLRSKKR